MSKAILIENLHLRSPIRDKDTVNQAFLSCEPNPTMATSGIVVAHIKGDEPAGLWLLLCLA